MDDPMTQHPMHGKTTNELHGKAPGAKTAEIVPPTKEIPTPAAAAPSPAFNTLLGSPLNNPPITEDAENLLLSDPKKFVQLVENKVEQKMQRASQQKANIDNFWNDFYQDNSDLKEVKWHVESVLREKLLEWNDKPTNDAKKLLAEEARRRIDLLRRNSGVKVETLQTEKATTLPASGEPAMRASEPAPQAPISFVEEMQQLRAKKRSRT